MISINFSIDQLIEAVHHLNDAEKEQLREVLDVDSDSLSDEQKQIVLDRQQAYNSGNMEAYSMEELKVMLKYTED